MGLQTFKKFDRARKAAAGGPIVRLAGLYVVGVGRLDSIELIEPVRGEITAQITMRHLDRLGNGNYAEPSKTWAANRTNARTFPMQEQQVAA